MNRLPAPVAAEPASGLLPKPAAPGITAEGFCPCAQQPQTPAQLAAQQALYQLAFAEAQKVATPSLPERDLPGVWN